MTDIEKVVLLGLKKYGSSKRIADILDEAHIPHSPATRLEIAVSLESKGLLQNAIYQLPLNIHAELSEEGHRVAETLESNETGLGQVLSLLFICQVFRELTLEYSHLL
jgi:hypothetical protein